MAPKEPFVRDRSMEGPVEDGQDVVFDTDFTHYTRAIYLGATGNLSVVLKSGTTMVFEGVPKGFLAVRASRINSTGTDIPASALKACW